MTPLRTPSPVNPTPRSSPHPMGKSDNSLAATSKQDVKFLVKHWLTCLRWLQHTQHFKQQDVYGQILLTEQLLNALMDVNSALKSSIKSTTNSSSNGNKKIPLGQLIRLNNILITQ